VDEGAFRLRKAGEDHDFELSLRCGFDLVGPYRS